MTAQTPVADAGEAVAASQNGDIAVTPWRSESDPFAAALPAEISALIGGLPDDRDAEEILRDLSDCRVASEPGAPADG